MSYNCSGRAYSVDLRHDSARATELLTKKTLIIVTDRKTALFSLSEMRYQIDPLPIKMMTGRN